jgi:hypothetical protein
VNVVKFDEGVTLNILHAYKKLQIARGIGGIIEGGTEMSLPVQTKDELDDLYYNHEETGRILKIKQLSTRDGRPFWLFTVRMKRYFDIEKNFRIESEERRGTWTFVSWKKIENAEADRRIFFDLTGNKWKDYEEIADVDIDWTTKFKPLGQEPMKAPALSAQAVEKYEPSGAEKNRYAIEKGALPLERGLQRLTFGLGSEDVSVYSGKFDHRVWQALLVCAAKIVKTSAKTQFESVDEFQEVYKYLWNQGLDEHFYYTPSVCVTDSDIRRLLHRPKMSSRDCENLMGLLPKLVFRLKEFQGIAMKGKDGKQEWKEYSVEDIHGFAGVKVGKTKHMKRGRGAGEEERAYEVYFDSLSGLAFWHNLAGGAYSLLTNNGVAEKFLALPGHAQMVVCAIWSWRDARPAILNAEQWLAIMGRKRAERADHYQRQLRRLEKDFEALKKEGFVSGWKRLKSGAYQLDKIKALKGLQTKALPPRSE